MKVTIVDIAKDTGLSLSTISKYLNNKNVLPENKIMIEKSIEKLGYKPNCIAQSLRAKSSRTVALLMPSTSDEFWGSIIPHIETPLRQNGYKTIIYFYSRDSLQQTKLANTLISNKVDGVIAISPYFDNSAFPLLCKSRIPMIMIDQKIESLQTDFVASDNYRGGYLAGRYLADHHHERIGFVSGLPNAYTMRERIHGFMDALKDARLPLYPEYYSTQKSPLEDGGNRTESLMNLPVPPTALFFLGNSLCLDGIQKLQEMNVRIPEELSVLGFDDNNLFPSLDPALTVIRQDFHMLGNRAAELMLDRIQGKSDNFPTHALTPVNLIERESVRFLS